MLKFQRTNNKWGVMAEVHKQQWATNAGVKGVGVGYSLGARAAILICKLPPYMCRECGTGNVGIFA